MDYKKILRIAGAIVFLLVFALLIYYWANDDANNNQGPQDQEKNNDRVKIEKTFDNKIVYTSDMDGVEKGDLEEDCAQRGGRFEECGNICAPGADICAEVCAYTCILEEGDEKQSYNWTEYDNSELGFSVLRIDEMKVETEAEGENRVEFMFIGPTQKQGTELYDGIRVLVSRISHESSESLEDLSRNLAEQTTEAVGEILEPVEIDSSYDFATYRFRSSGLGEYTHLIAPIFPGEAFEIAYFSSHEKYEPQVEKMIKSFRITDSQAIKTSLSGEVEVSSPLLEQTVSSPFKIEGQARGFWFFEASFNAVLTDWDGRIIGEALVTSPEDWMTEEFIPFEAEMEFTRESDYDSDLGYLILQKSNPSGLPQNDMALEFPVYLE